VSGLATYTYRAARADGALELGELTAGSREEAARALSARGLFPLEVAPAAERRAGRAHARLRELALGLRVLATLLEAGLPVGRALAAMPELVPPVWRAGLPMIRRAVAEGDSLGAALAASPVPLPPVVLGVIRAGEAGSGLAVAVARAAELLEEMAATRAAIRSALAYPAVLALAGIASMALLVGVVLPRFAAILGDLGQALPPTTRLVLAAATLVRAGAVPATLALAAAWGLGRAWLARPEGRSRAHALLLRIPVLGGVRRAAATGRACAALAALLESGVPASTALRHAARASGDAALEQALLAAREAILTGERPWAALERLNALTPTAVRLVRAGEETGRLAALLGHAARLERERAERTVKTAVRLLEPALLLAFGGLVALVAAALLQAIYSVRPV
jgi:general secretion pathway protein F